MHDISFLTHSVGSADRIHIIGGPGAGKSTLARRLGATLGLPVHTLDTVAYEGPEFTARSREAAEQTVREIAATPQWVTEGIFVGWTDPLLDRADLIVWLDYLGWHEAAARIVVRSFRDALGEARVRHGRGRFLRFEDYGRHLRQLLFVVSASREYWFRRPAGSRRYPVTREETEEALTPHAEKVVRITDRREIDALEALKPSGFRTEGVSRPTGHVGL